VRMNRWLAIALGLLGLAPLASLAFILFVLVPRAKQATPPGDLSFMIACISLGIFGLLVMAFYVVVAWRSERVPQALKRRWASLLLIGNLFTIPVFWYLFMWKDRPVERRPTLEEYVSGAA